MARVLSRVLVLSRKKPGRTNQVADALSRRAYLAAAECSKRAWVVSQVVGTLAERLKEVKDIEPWHGSRDHGAEKGTTRNLWLMALHPREQVVRAEVGFGKCLSRCVMIRLAGARTHCTRDEGRASY